MGIWNFTEIKNNKNNVHKFINEKSKLNKIKKIMEKNIFPFITPFMVITIIIETVKY
jgi:hypothetical protein